MIARCRPPIAARCIPASVHLGVCGRSDSSGLLGSEEDAVERLHMNYLRALIHRLRAHQCERGISRDLRISRMTVLRHHELAER